tara:strand:+ start:675 stop:1124 length:450 start_codon:yes stop_codon:yes gene_type:complete
MKIVEVPFKPRNGITGRSVEKTKKTLRYIEHAANMAQQSDYGKIRHGAVLVKGGSILSAAYNKSNFNSFGNRFRKHDRGHATHHAELGCILGIDRSKTSGSTVYVVRINKEGEYRLSKPCSMCHEILKFCGVRKVVYTVDEDKIASYKL